MANCLYLFGAGREKRVYAIPPHTRAEPIDFEDYPFYVEQFGDRVCARCGLGSVYMNEVPLEDGGQALVCSDAGNCDRRIAEAAR
jgi:alpha-D-ribose 1-methylphosphonate 5-phosphate C-P lyase